MGFGWSLDLYTIIYLVYSMTELPIEDQCEILKERLIELMAEKIYPYTIPMWGNLPNESYEQNILGTRRTSIKPGKLYYKFVAKEILKESYPEIKWDGRWL